MLSGGGSIKGKAEMLCLKLPETSAGLKLSLRTKGFTEDSGENHPCTQKTLDRNWKIRILISCHSVISVARATFLHLFGLCHSVSVGGRKICDYLIAILCCSQEHSSGVCVWIPIPITSYFSTSGTSPVPEFSHL